MTRRKDFRPDVALLVETSTSWGRQIVRGICDYAFHHGGWHFHLEPHGRYEEVSLPAGWRGDGVIGRITTERLAKQLVAQGIAAVNVSCYEFETARIPVCTCDEEAIGTMAADYLLRRGHRNFAYFGDSMRRHYNDRLGNSFISYLGSKGFPCNICKLPAKLGRTSHWSDSRKWLESWLRSLPKPLGLLVWNDVRGRQITEACRHCGIRVPADVAIVSGGLDDLLGEISRPPLTAVDPSARQVGFVAASILDKLMNGETPQAFHTIIPPVGIVEKQSTEILAVDDEYLANALAFIKENALRGICVEDVVRHVSLSRRGLECRFRQKLGTSPLKEIRHLRMSHARHLLVNTHLHVGEIADACGYRSPDIFTRAFTQYYGQSPLQCRKMG